MVERSRSLISTIRWKPRYNTNEPAQLCVLSAIEAAVGHLLAQRIERRLWQLAGDSADGIATVDKYLSQNQQP